MYGRAGFRDGVREAFRRIRAAGEPENTRWSNRPKTLDLDRSRQGRSIGVLAALIGAVFTEILHG